jgi:hypothetical protein
MGIVRTETAQPTETVHSGEHATTVGIRLQAQGAAVPLPGDAEASSWRAAAGDP